MNKSESFQIASTRNGNSIYDCTFHKSAGQFNFPPFVVFNHVENVCMSVLAVNERNEVNYQWNGTLQVILVSQGQLCVNE